MLKMVLMEPRGLPVPQDTLVSLVPLAYQELQVTLERPDPPAATVQRDRLVLRAPQAPPEALVPREPLDQREPQEPQDPRGRLVLLARQALLVRLAQLVQPGRRDLQDTRRMASTVPLGRRASRVQQAPQAFLDLPPTLEQPVPRDPLARKDPQVLLDPPA